MEIFLQTLAIIISVIGSAYYIHREVKTDIDLQTSRIDAANTRTDQLYQMFIDLLKEGRKK